MEPIALPLSVAPAVIAAAQANRLASRVRDEADMRRRAVATPMCQPLRPRDQAELQNFEIIGAPYRNRTGVSALRGPRPGPLDEGSVTVEIAPMARACKRCLIAARRGVGNETRCHGRGFAVAPGRARPPRTHESQGSVANLIRPVSFSVLTSKVRISVAPAISSVTTMRSSATAVAVTRAPFGKVIMASARRRGAVSAGAVNTVADDADHSRDRKERGQARYDHQPAHPRDHAGGDGVEFGLAAGSGRSRTAVSSAVLLPLVPVILARPWRQLRITIDTVDR